MDRHLEQFIMKYLRRLNNNVSLLSWQHVAASLLLGFSIGFFVYILFLQTPTFSRRYLFLGIVIVVAVSLAAYILLKRHPFASQNDYFISWRPFVLACLLFFLALPSYFFFPPYPDLPFFQRTSTLVISIQTGTDPVAWSQFRRVFLNSGIEKFGFRAFRISGSWIPHGDDFILPPESIGQITWQGRIGRRASLSLPVPSDEVRILTVWDDEVREVPTGKNLYVRNKNFLPPLWYAVLVYTVTAPLLFFGLIMMDGFLWARRIALSLLILGLSLLQTELQFKMLEEEFYKPLQDALETVQLSRHLAVLNGSAPNPWQYRVFSEWIVEAFIFISSRILSVNNAPFMSFFYLRILQNLILLSLAYLYFVRLGITKTIAVYGLFLLAGGMFHTFYQSDLSFNTYFDIIFFLLAGILILDTRYEWVPLLMLPAALNRETSLLIPILLIAWGWFGRSKDRRRAVTFGVIGLLVWGLTFVTLRLYYPDAPMFRIGDELLPGWELFRYNLTIHEMPILLFQTLGFLPLLGIIAYRHWSPFVRIGFLILVPVWILVHAFSSIWAETRLFLVLLAMVFVPAVLPVVDRQLQEIRQTVSSESNQIQGRETILIR